MRNRAIIRWSVLALLIFSFSAASFAQVFVSVRFGPPALPVYAQPLCPGPGYYWTPGYWAWNDDGGYYWVPGTWVIAPVGMLWTPGYWGWGGGFYAWHAGYWGPHIGFYGGINYGFGYTGVGFVGGEWRGGAFYYNRSVTNVSVTNVTNVYNKTVVVNNTTVNNVSYNGGEGGLKAQPRPEELAAEREHHEAPLAVQTQHQQLASQNKQNFASENHGRPAVAATARAADFSGHSAIAARSAGGEYHAPTMSPKEARGPSTPGNRPFTPANSSNANRTAGTSSQDKSNGGYRPFTPPNSNSSNAKTTGGSPSPSPQNKTENKSNEGFRPFTPPSNSSKSNSANTNANHSSESHSQPAAHEESQPHAAPTTHEQSQPHAAPAPKSTPPPSHKSSPPPPKKGNNNQEHHR